MNRTWYTSFFTGVVVEMWRDAISPEHTRLEADYLAKELRLSPGARVLDVPCGHGRHSVELARRGYRMTGVDISPEMIRAAQAHAASAGVQVEWRNAEMRELAGPAQFDAAFCFGNSFGYLDREGTAAFLGGIAQVLRPKARFAFDYGLAAECILPRFTAREWTPVGDLYFLENNRYDASASCIETTYTFIRNGSVDTRTGVQWVYTVGEIRAMLQQAGLNVCSLSASCGGQAFELGSPVLVVVAEKT